LILINKTLYRRFIRLYLSRLPCFRLPLIKAASNQGVHGSKNTCFYQIHSHFKKIDKIILTLKHICRGRHVFVCCQYVPRQSILIRQKQITNSSDVRFLRPE